MKTIGNNPLLSTIPLNQRGLTLVELMVAITIGVFLTGAVAALYANTRTGFDYSNEVARMQENGRFALEVLSRDIRMAGYNGCGRNVSTANVVNGNSSDPMLDFSTPIHGYNDGNIPQFLSDAGALSSSDALILIGGAGGDLVVKSHNPPSAQIDTNTHSIKPGEILLITDCSKASIFQITGPTNNNNNATNVVHNTGTGTPGNCTKFLGASCPNSSSYTYKPGSILMRLSSSAYFIGNSSLNDGSHSLYVLELDGTTVTQSARELLTGVHDMQITYGLVDTEGSFDVKSFDTAQNITNNNWSKVIIVRISLTMRSSKTNISTEHGALEKVFTETVVARNRTM
jgi:type IV pilus assembly protein PilW